MPEYIYLDLDNGNDANSGLTSALPKKTFAAAVALFTAGDDSRETLYWKGTTRTAQLTLSGLTSKTVSEWPGSTGTIRGDTVIATTGWSADGNGYAKNIGAGLTLSSVVYDWDNCVNSDGRHYGHCLSDTLANVQGAADTKGRYNYNSVTGVLTVFVPGSTIATTSDNPASSGKTLAYCAAEGINAGIYLHECTDCEILGGTVCLFPTYTNQDGWGVWVNDSTNCLVSGVRVIDCGAHGIGSYGGTATAAGLQIVSCQIHGLRPDATHAVFYQDDDSFGNMTGTVTGGTIRGGRWLSTNGSVLTHRPYSSVTNTAMGANTQILVYGHGRVGTPFAAGAVKINNVLLAADEQMGGTVEVANTDTVAAGYAFSEATLQCDHCTFTGMGYVTWNTNGLAFRGCTWSQTRQLPENVGAKGAINFGWDGGSSNREMLWESCAFTFDLSDTAAGASSVRAFYVAVAGGTVLLRLVNCSIYDNSSQTATNFHGWFDNDGRNAKLYSAVGCIFDFRNATTTTALYFNDVGVSVANHECLDCRYKGISDAAGRWSQVAAIDTSTEFIANVDTAGAVVTGTVYPSPTTSLGLTTASALWSSRRSTTTTEPSGTSVNNQEYTGFFGAYQYPALATVRNRDADNDARNWRRR